MEINYELFERDIREYRPRPYQDACRQAVQRWWESTSTSSALAVLATGLGKTEIAAELIRGELAQGRGSLLIEPFIDLTSQTAARLRSRGVPCGIEQGALRSDEDVTVACYASLLSRDRWQNYVGRVKRVVVDEVHLNFSPSSMKMLDAFIEGGAKVLGMTATPDRGGDPLTKWYGPVAFSYTYHDAKRDGWLVPSRIWLTVLEDLDLSAFKRATPHADFDQRELARIMAQEANVQAIGSAIEQHYDQEPSLVFCQGIRQAERLIEDLKRRGIYCSIVHSKMDASERRMHLADFEKGDTQVIANIGCLTTGYDFPPLKKIFIAKPTLSRAKYGQMFGRGVRPLPGIVDRFDTVAGRKKAIAESAKPYFELFDLTDSSRLNDLQTAVDVLFPEEDPKLLKRVRARVERNGGEADIDEILEEERAAEAAEQAARDQLQMSLRAGLVAHGKFGAYERSDEAKAEQPLEGKKAVRFWKFMPFGKHKGERLKSIPTPYLRWVISGTKVDPGLMGSITEELARRNK